MARRESAAAARALNSEDAFYLEAIQAQKDRKRRKKRERKKGIIHRTLPPAKRRDIAELTDPSQEIAHLKRLVFYRHGWVHLLEFREGTGSYHCVGCPAWVGVESPRLRSGGGAVWSSTRKFVVVDERIEPT
jgi:hypothetical protein